MAEEHTNKVVEFESNVGGDGAVETQDRGMFDFSGEKKEDEKPQAQADVIANYVDKVKVEETKADEEHKEDEKKHSTLLEKLHRSGSSSSYSSDEEVGEDGEKKKKKKEKKVGESAVPETAEKKGVIEKIKEKLPGQHKKDEDVTAALPPPAATTESVVVGHHEEESKEKKGILEKIKEKLPGYHSKTEDEKEKESSAAANH